MRVDDGPAVARVLRAAYAAPTVQAEGAPGGPRVPITEPLVERWRSHCARSWVALAPPLGPVGAVFAVAEPEVGWIAGLGVDPGFRRLGLGAALTEAALAFLRERRCPMLGLEVWPHSTDVLVMYARRGFVPVDSTVRLRMPSFELEASGGSGEWQRIALLGDWPADVAGWPPPLPPAEAVAGCIVATPLSGTAFALDGAPCGVPAVLVCEPEPTAPPQGGSLEIRRAWIDVSSSEQALEEAVAAAAVAARASSLRHLEIDLPLGDGRAVGALCRLGFTAVATVLRLSDRPDRYSTGGGNLVVAGRWSL